jgi:hypothetical protein
MSKSQELLGGKHMLNLCKYLGNYFGVKSFLHTFAHFLKTI